MSYDPREHGVTARDGAAGALVWVLALAVLAFLGDRLPDQEALALPASPPALAWVAGPAAGPGPHGCLWIGSIQ